MASEVSICNRALQKLGASRISSLTADSKNARACNANYTQIRDSELRKHRWNFSKIRIQLAADSTVPVFGKLNFFTLPPDCMRILPPKSFDVDWEVEGRKIATNWTAPLDLIYISRVTDPNTMDVNFREMVSSKLAEEMCEEITQSNTKRATAFEDYKEARAEAKRNNAFESISQEAPEDDWIIVRTQGVGRMRANNPYA